MSLHQHVNASGFPLQLALANAVRAGSGNGWTVLYEEHAWKLGEDSGFMDLVLEDQYKTWLMNIECKRVRDTDWIFLRPNGATSKRKHAKLWVTHRSPQNTFCDWTDVPMDPGTAESQYCVVPGQDAKARPMLERVAASVIQSTEALAKEELETVSDRYSQLRIYQSVIVTTAALKVCEVDVGKIDLGNGEIEPGTTFIDVPYVRFRKQLGATAPSIRPAQDTFTLTNQMKSRESTVFVVNASHFIDFLAESDLPSNFEQYCRAR